MSNKPPVDLSAMNRAFFEALDPAARVELLCRLHTMTVELSERLAQNSANSSRPPSSDSPSGGTPPAGGPGGGGLGNALKGSVAAGVGTTPGTPRKPGKQPGAKGIWRCEALTAERTENHYPDRCAAWGAPLELWHGECVQISWTKDGGRSSETGLQGLVSNHLTLLGHNGLGGERFRKRRGLTASGMVERDERK